MVCVWVWVCGRGEGEATLACPMLWEEWGLLTLLHKRIKEAHAVELKLLSDLSVMSSNPMKGWLAQTKL